MAQKARRDRRPPAQTPAADAEMVAGLETFGSDLPIGSGMETAAIGDVTPEMMDEAAYRAAEAVEAAADPSLIQAGLDGQQSPGEPGPHVAMDPDVSSPFECHTDNRDAVVSPEDDVVEAMPVLPSSPVGTTDTSTFVEAAAASIGAEVVALEEATGSLIAPAPTAQTEADEGTGETLRWDLSSPGEAIGAYGAQVVEMVAATMAANSHFLTALMSATSVTDVMALNTNHLRRQVELLTAQRRQLTTLARTIAFDAMKPFSVVPTDHRRDR